MAPISSRPQCVNTYAKNCNLQCYSCPTHIPTKWSHNKKKRQCTRCHLKDIWLSIFCMVRLPTHVPLIFTYTSMVLPRSPNKTITIAFQGDPTVADDLKNIASIHSAKFHQNIHIDGVIWRFITKICYFPTKFSEVEAIKRILIPRLLYRHWKRDKPLRNNGLNLMKMRFSAWRLYRWSC